MKLRKHWIFFFTFSVNQFCWESQGQDMSQTWGWPNPNDSVYKKTITESYRLFHVTTHTEKINSGYRVNAVKFWDDWKNGADITMEKEPPFYSSTFTIKSRSSRGFKFIMEVYYDKTKSIG